MRPAAWRALVPALSLVALLLAVFWLQPRTMSYLGLNLLFNLRCRSPSPPSRRC